MEDFFSYDEDQEVEAVNRKQLTLFKGQQQQQQQLINFDRKNCSKMLQLNGNIIVRGGLAKVKNMVLQSRCISTTVVRKLDQGVKENDDLVVDYLDGDRTGIVVFGLNRPAAKNSFSRNLVTQLIDAVEAVKFDRGARVVIIKSTTPGIFCAGADLKERAKMPAHLVGAFVGKARRLISDLENLPMPVIAAIDGHALGKAIQFDLFRVFYSNLFTIFYLKVVVLKWHLPATYVSHPIQLKWVWSKQNWQSFLVLGEHRGYHALLGQL